MWLAPSRTARLQVTYRIAGCVHAFERHAKAAANLLKQTRQRLAAIATLFRAVGAIKNRINPSANSRQHFVHFGVDRIERRHIKQSASQT